MKNAYRLFVVATVAAGAALPLVAREAVLAAESNTYEYRIDTTPSPRAIKTQEELAGLMEATYFAGETVTATLSGGAASTLVSAAAANGSVAPGFNAGGVWTLANSAQGSATFTVRHSIFGTLGEGTSASPAKIVDGLELFDLYLAGTAGNGYVYELVGVEGLSPLLPPDYGRESAGGNLLRLVEGGDTAEDTFVTPQTVWFLDSMQGGPDRTIMQRRGYFAAYSGDNWARSATAASTLSVTPPRGTASTQNLTGTGAVPFVPSNGKGDYTVVLTAGSTTRTAIVTYAPLCGLMIFVK